MEDNRENRNQDRDHRGGGYNRNRGNRFNRHSGGGHNQHGGRGGRSQRPLLTSAINAAGMSLVALVFLFQNFKEQFHNVQLLGWTVLLFGLSSVISYVAQRVRPTFVEKLSDLCFLAGVVVLVCVAINLSGIFGSTPPL